MTSSWINCCTQYIRLNSVVVRFLGYGIFIVSHIKPNLCNALFVTPIVTTTTMIYLRKIIKPTSHLQAHTFKAGALEIEGEESGSLEQEHREAYGKDLIVLYSCRNVVGKS